MEKSYQGSCHCGSIVFEIETEIIKFTKCDCSLCKKKNALMTKVHESKFRLLKGKKQLGEYQWNTGIAKHHFCTRCGIYTFHRKRVAPDFLEINVFCLGNIDMTEVPVIEVDGVSMSTKKQRHGS